jgi:pseudaminic acid cytidylyltransferase
VNICIIPARGGSKRIPQKNIKDFLGKPIIVYSIEEALKSKLFDRVIVSTDDKDIAKIAEKFGAEVPFIRPKELSDDFTGTNDVVSHAINFLIKQGEKLDYVCCIYATAPFISQKYLIEGFEYLKNSSKLFAFSVTSFAFPIQRAIKIEDGKLSMFYPKYLTARSQDLKESYHDAGQFYWGKAKAFLSNENMFSEKSVPIVLPRYLVQDIDTMEDWNRAEFMYKIIQNDKQ